jgi:hypothetical protein
MTYFNRHREAPQVWAIDEGDQSSEINVCGFYTSPECTVKSGYNCTPANDSAPSAWIEVTAEWMSVAQGIALFL